MFGFLRNKKPKVAAVGLGLIARARNWVKARYDSSVTNDDNRRHWANADGLSAAAANSPAVRATIRNRARYERDNSPLCNGMVETLANYVIGTGPRLQLNIEDDASARKTEDAFDDWSNAIGLPEKLRCMLKSRVVDGEAVAIFTTNDKVQSRVKLDVKLIECDRLTTPNVSFFDPNAVDGIRFDKAGNPVEYHILKTHPGDVGMRDRDYDKLDPKDVIHLFRLDRPGQVRGISQLQPSLELFPKLRRFISAVLSAAEWAASIAGCLSTEAPALGEDDDSPDVEAMDTIEVEKGSLLTTPKGYKAFQLKAEQPATTFKDFKREIVAEAARPLHMPYNIAACDSSAYNYASGRLDHQTFQNAVAVERDDMERKVLDRIFSAWHAEASRLTGPTFLPQSLRTPDPLPRSWMWRTGFSEHVDPSKGAKAVSEDLNSGVTNLKLECAKRGLDWIDVVRQRGVEVKLMRDLGIEQAKPATEPVPALPPDEGGDNVE